MERDKVIPFSVAQGRAGHAPGVSGSSKPASGGRKIDVDRALDILHEELANSRQKQDIADRPEHVLFYLGMFFSAVVLVGVVTVVFLELMG